MSKLKSILLIIFCILLIIIGFIYFFYFKSNEIKSNEIKSNEIKSNEKIDEKPIFVSADVPIFMYHFISQDPGNNPYPQNVVTPKVLEEQLKYIFENGYESIYISDFDNLKIYKKPIVLTFDDGFADFYYNAFPLLKKYNIKSTLFVVKDFIGKQGYCNETQIKELIDSGIVAIEAHSVTHPYLSTLISEKEIIRELKESKEGLKEMFGIDSTVFCYPYGSFNDKVVEIAKTMYKYALDMKGGIYYTNKNDNYKIPRIYVYRTMKLNTYISYLNKSNVNIILKE